MSTNLCVTGGRSVLGSYMSGVLFEIWRHRKPLSSTADVHSLTLVKGLCLLEMLLSLILTVLSFLLFVISVWDTAFYVLFTVLVESLCVFWDELLLVKKIQSCDREVCLTPTPSNDSRIKTITTSKVTSVTLSDEYFLRWLMSSMFHFVVCCIKSMLTWYVLVFNTSQMFLSLFLFSVISIHVGECSCKPLVNCRDFWYDHFPMGCPKSQSRSVSCEYDNVEQLTYTNVFNGSSFGHRPLERLCDFGRLMSAVTFTVPAPSLLCCLSVLRSTDTPL